MPPYHLRILHISDLHERALFDGMPAERRLKVRATAASRHRVLDFRRGKLADILAEVRAAGPVDLVCFTGDAADWGLAEEYARAQDRLDAILNALGVARERLFLVPGNHDVQRPRAADAWRELRRLAALPAHSQAVSDWMAGLVAPYGAHDAWRDEIGQRTAEFWRWVREGLGRADLVPAAGPHGRLGYRVSVDGLGLPFPVHIIGLDSAWLAGDDHDQGKLLLTDRQVDMLACDESGAGLPGFRLCLIHHPLYFLADGDRCQRLLAEGVDLLLHGHQHDPIAEAHEDPDRGLRVIAAGSLYEGDEGDRWPNSFHVVDAWLDGDGQPLWYDLEFFGWSERGHWFRTGAIYREARDGRLRWPTPRGRAWLAERERVAASDPHRRAADFFVGRDDELAQLARALLRPAASTRAAAIGAVQGMPGVGKSYLAARFAVLHSDDFSGGVVRITFAADDTRSAEAVGRDLCDQLGLRVAGSGSAWELLRGHLRGNGILLVVENADAEPQAQAAAGLAARLAPCPMIITGRYRMLGRTAGAGWVPVTVRPFDEPHALAQLAGEHRPPADAAEEVGYRDFVRSLGYLPLAIHLAAGYLAQPGATAAGFLAELHRSGLALAHRDPADPISEQGARAILSTTFDLSLKALTAALSPDGGRLVAAFAALGHAPLAGVGRSLGAASVGLDASDFERLVIAAGSLSLLEVDESGRRFRLHPLLAELLRPRVEAGPAVARMTEWFLARLPEQPGGQAAEQGRLWGEIRVEGAALVEWLRAVPTEVLRRVERGGSRYAMRNGPFRAWMQLCERGLRETDDPGARSDFLWTLGQLAQNAGEIERALEAAQQKIEVDRERGDDREIALAQGLVADVLQARGQLDEALRIRQEEELPTYERLGDVRSRAVTLGQIADVFEARGQLDEALRIRQEEQLPVYERLGARRDLLVARANIALTLLDRNAPGDRDEAIRLLRQALDDARAMRIPEAGQIETILAQVR